MNTEVLAFQVKISDEVSESSSESFDATDYCNLADQTIANLSHTVYFPDKFEAFNENNIEVIQMPNLDTPIINLLAQYYHRPVSFYEKVGSNFSMRCPKLYKLIGILFGDKHT